DDAIDVDAMLAGLGEDIESYGIGAFAHQETRVVRRRMNWKLVSDTFWEAYHIKVLHAQNVGPLFVKNLAMFDAFGRNTRYIGVRKSIEKLRDLPEEKWDLIPHTTILMNLFPNTILVMQSDHAEVYRIFPADAHVGESVATISILAPDGSPARRRRSGFHSGRGHSARFRVGRAQKSDVRPLRKRTRTFPPLNPRSYRGSVSSAHPADASIWAPARNYLPARGPRPLPMEPCSIEQRHRTVLGSNQQHDFRAAQDCGVGAALDQAGNYRCKSGARARFDPTLHQFVVNDAMDQRAIVRL